MIAWVRTREVHTLGCTKGYSKLGLDAQGSIPSVLTSIKCESPVTKRGTEAIEIVRTELARFPV